VPAILDRQVAGNDDLPNEPGVDTWMFMCERYGLTLWDEACFVQELKQVTTLPYCLNSTVVDIMADVDD